MEIASWVTAISTSLMAIATFALAVVTFKTLRAQGRGYEAYLSVVDSGSVQDPSQPHVQLRNLGPGAAFRVQLRAIWKMSGQPEYFQGEAGPLEVQEERKVYFRRVKAFDGFPKAAGQNNVEATVWTITGAKMAPQWLRL